MNENNPNKTEKRQKLFLSILKEKKFTKNIFFIFKASSFLLISLDYSLASKIIKSIKYLLISLINCPIFIFTKRPYSILIKILKIEQ